VRELWTPDVAAPTPEVFRGVMGRFATGVALMTTVVDGAPHGMTANAVTSVSLEPLLVMVSVERRTVMAERVTTAGVFALSFLTTDQEELSDWFADPGRPLDERQFSGVETAPAATGAPVLPQGLGWLDCEVWAVHDGGDHLLVLGEVVALEEGADEPPLVFYRGRYGSLEGR
jgi:flavin reductase (DIM6/NTAB) family NADH-FMN oxidoreductase RutF